MCAALSFLFKPLSIWEAALSVTHTNSPENRTGTAPLTSYKEVGRQNDKAQIKGIFALSAYRTEAARLCINFARINLLRLGKAIVILPRHGGEQIFL